MAKFLKLSGFNGGQGYLNLDCIVSISHAELPASWLPTDRPPIPAIVLRMASGEDLTFKDEDDMRKIRNYLKANLLPTD